MLSISTKYLINKAIKRNYEVNIIDKTANIFQISHDGRKYLFKNIDGGINSSLGQKISRNKDLTYKLLEFYGINYPKTIILSKNQEIDYNKIIETLGFPIVIKPSNTNHGIGISMKIKSVEMLEEGIKEGFKYSSKIIIQRQIKGKDHRILVVGNKVVAGIKKTPCKIIGNGINTIKELIEDENKNPLRGEVINLGNTAIYTKPLVSIKINERVKKFINNKYNYDFDSIPQKNEKIYLKGNSNISTGGTYIDITDNINEITKKQCIEFSKAIGLKVCGVDIMSSDISKPMNENGGGIIEVNSTPGIDMHDNEISGINRNVCGKILDLYFH
ncbi:MAG: hypothetical protein V3575_01750 [Candidatus Absconditabacteria bacterium]